MVLSRGRDGCIGAPIRDHLGNVIAALSISGPQKKIGTPHEKHFVTEIVRAAALISSKLGYAEVKKNVIEDRKKS